MEFFVPLNGESVSFKVCLPAPNPSAVCPKSNDASMRPATVPFTLKLSGCASVVPKNLVPSVMLALPVVDHANPFAGEASVFIT